MRVLLTTIGSRGDVQPLVALGAALQKAGHSVRLAAPPEFRELAQSANVPFRSIGAAFRDLAQGELAPKNWAGGVVSLWHTFNATVREVVAETADHTLVAARDTDLIVASGHQFLGATAAESLGIKYVYACLGPVSDRSSAYPPVALAGLAGNPRLNRMAWRMTEMMATSALGPPLNAVRAKLGLPRVRDVLAHVIFDQPALLAFSRHVCPPAPDWPKQHRQVGYWFLDEHWTAPRNLSRFLAAEPPVYVGFGSMGTRDPLRTMRLILEAARAADVRVLLGGTWGGLGGENGRADARAYALDGEVPHSWLFPRVRALVHHGGAGTTAAGLRAAKVTGIVPHLGDQYFWGRRVNALKLGPAPLALRQLNVDRLASILASVVDTPGFEENATALSQQLVAEDGLGEAVRAIEALHAGAELTA
jgi:sterol 3beta-glucosyltransferase